MGPLQPEQGSSVVTSASGGNSGNTDANGNMGSSVTVSSPPRVVLWTRLPGNDCKSRVLERTQIISQGRDGSGWIVWTGTMK